MLRGRSYKFDHSPSEKKSGAEVADDARMREFVFVCYVCVLGGGETGRGLNLDILQPSL